MFEDAYLKRKRPNRAKLLRYGFCPQGDALVYETDVMDGQFRLHACIDGQGALSTRMIERATGEPYALYRLPSTRGAFVGAVRAAADGVLTAIARACFEPDAFHGAQARALIAYVRETYGDELEFLWENSSNAVWRRQDSRKWYAALLTIPRCKLGLEGEDAVEIIDLRIEPQAMAQTVDGKRFFPGWHMNKAHWYTVIMDESVSTEALCARIDKSYALAGKGAPRKARAGKA